MEKTQMQCLEKSRCANNATECDIDCPGFDKLLRHQYGVDTLAPAVRGGPKRGCPLRPRFCKCPAKVNRLKYCNPRIKCQVLRQVTAGCRWACIYVKIKLCPKHLRALKQKTRKFIKLLWAPLYADSCCCCCCSGTPTTSTTNNTTTHAAVTLFICYQLNRNT